MVSGCHVNSRTYYTAAPRSQRGLQTWPPWTTTLKNSSRLQSPSYWSLTPEKHLHTATVFITWPEHHCQVYALCYHMIPSLCILLFWHSGFCLLPCLVDAVYMTIVCFLLNNKAWTCDRLLPDTGLSLQKLVGVSSWSLQYTVMYCIWVILQKLCKNPVTRRNCKQHSKKSGCHFKKFLNTLLPLRNRKCNLIECVFYDLHLYQYQYNWLLNTSWDKCYIKPELVQLQQTHTKKTIVTRK